VIEHYEFSTRCSSSIAQGMTGVVNVALPSSFEGLAFIDKFRLFLEKYPLVDLNTLVKPHNELVASVKSGKADLGIGSPEDMEQSPDFSVIKLREDPAVMLCGARHPLARSGKINAKMLKDATIVMSGPEGMPHTYKHLQTIGFKPGFEKNSVLKVNNLDEMLLMIELGRGIGFLPAFVTNRVALGMPGIVCIECEFDGETPMMTTAAGYLKENQNPVLENLIELLV